MAFEAILSQSRAAPSRWRRITFTFSVLAHAVALGFGVVHSIWQVDEMAMPAIEVTLSVAPPPPPPPPPPPKRSTAKKTKPVPKAITAPKETPKVEPEPEPPQEEESEDEGVEGGVVGGIVGGVVGGAAPPPPKSTGPKVLSAKAGHSLLAINPQVRPYKVNVPEEFVARGEEFVSTIKICVSPNGAVASLDVLRPSGNPVVDSQIKQVVPKWKYRQFMVDGAATGFCYAMNYRVK